jgi:DNA-binding MarR family transcriptional regulator
MNQVLTLSDYRALAELRYQIRGFAHFSEQAARAVGLEPRQHQLMLTLKGLPEGVRPRIRELAKRLRIQHHSAVELANRLASGGYVRRRRGGQDRREVLLSLTSKGEKVLRNLSLHHRAELRSQGPALVSALQHAMQVGRNSQVKTMTDGLRKGERLKDVESGSRKGRRRSGKEDQSRLCQAK